MSSPRRRDAHPDLEHYYDAATNRTVMDTHVSTCVTCRSWLDDIDARLRVLPCNQLVELVTGYFDDALDDDLRARVEDHLRLCEGCRNYLTQLRATLAVIGRSGRSTVPPEPVRAGLLAAFQSWKRTPTER